MKERRFVYLAMAFMLAFLATPAQYSLGMASVASASLAAAGRTANPSQLAAPNGLSDPIITLNPAVPDHTDPLNATLTQEQLNSSSYWNFYGSAPALGAYYAFYEDAGGLHIGVQPLAAGDWVGFFGVTPSTYATLAQATITAPSPTINGWYVTGLYSQTAVPGINGTFCGAVISSSGIVWQVSQINGTAYQATNFSVLWTDDSENQPLTRTCTMITNGDNYLAAFIDGREVYENSSLSLNMPSPFIWFLESQSSVPDHMAYGTFLAFHSSIVGESFDPADATISAGSTVQWVVPGGPDTIISDSGNWSSGPLSSGGSFSHTFTTPGVYGYHSVQHPWASGTITVLQDASAISVVRGPDNGIWYKDYYTATDTWSGWTWIGSTSDTPAAALSGGVLYIVARSLDGSTLQFGKVNDSTGVFSGWSSLSSPASGVTPHAPTLAANSNTLALVIQGLDNQVYYRLFDISNGTWSPWSASIGMTGMSPGATILGNELNIEVRDPSLSSLWYGSLNLTSLVFSGWQPHGALVQDMPTLAACPALNEVVLVMRGPGANIWYNERNATGWMGWRWVSSPGTADGMGATVIGQSLYLTIRSADGSLWTTSVDLVTHASAGWSSLAGASFSRPTMTS